MEWLAVPPPPFAELGRNRGLPYAALKHMRIFVTPGRTFKISAKGAAPQTISATFIPDVGPGMYIYAACRKSRIKRVVLLR
jgi:hypothetical protein